MTTSVIPLRPCPTVTSPLCRRHAMIRGSFVVVFVSALACLIRLPVLVAQPLETLLADKEAAANAIKSSIEASNAAVPWSELSPGAECR